MGIQVDPGIRIEFKEKVRYFLIRVRVIIHPIWDDEKVTGHEKFIPVE